MPSKGALPPVWLNSQVLKIFPDYMKYAEAERERVSTQMPPWCYIPSAWVFRIYAPFFLQGQMKNTSAGVAAHMLALWSKSRVVYSYSKELTDVLVEQENATVPTDSLMRLPQYCVCILNPPEPNATALYTCLDTCDEKTFLTMLYQYNDGQFVVDSIELLPDKTIEQSLEASRIDTAELVVANKNKMPDEMKDMFSSDRLKRPNALVRKTVSARVNSAINMLLYIVSDNAETVSERKKVPHTPSPIAPDATECPNRPTKYDVGIRIGAAIKAAREDVERQRAAKMSSPQHHTSPVPHMRRAHYHTYRVGEGRNSVIVHWIAPILVGAKAQADAPVTLYPVK